MRYIAILVIFLAGCAGSQHRHPHDHGLSAIKGQLNRTTRTNERLASVLNDVHIQLGELRGSIRNNQSRVEEAETELLKHDVFLSGVTRLDKQLMALEKQIGVNNADISKWFIEHERRMKELSVEIGSMQLSNGKLLTDIYSIANKNKRDLKRAKKQKLIELKEEDDRGR